jgi:hypothetical protein
MTAGLSRKQSLLVATYAVGTAFLVLFFFIVVGQLQARTLDKDAPFHRAIERLGVITSRPVLGGLHHQYCRI